MITIEPLTQITPADLQRLVTGYTTQSKFAVTKQETAAHTSISLQWVPLAEPFTKRYDPIDDEYHQRYNQIAAQGLSLAACDQKLLVGIAIAEARTWNNSLWVWEFHVDEAYRRQGIGKQLMDKLALNAKHAGLSRIVCETQNVNVPAINFYRKEGFVIEGIDLSLYSNEDYPDGEIAIYMKRRL